MSEYIELPEIVDDQLYDSRVSGAFLGNYKEPTMRNSRYTGKLAGVEAPAHIKMGPKALYLGKTLKAWRAQFSEQTKTQAA